MYTTLFMLITAATLLFYVTSNKVIPANKPIWSHRFARHPLLARIIATFIFLASWIAVGLLQGFGSGTFAMLGYLMASYSLVVLLNPLRYFNASRIAIIAIVAVLIEIFIF